MKQASYLILSILIITGCAYSSQRPDVVDRSVAQRAQSVTFATVVDIDRVVIAGAREVGAALLWAQQLVIQALVKLLLSYCLNSIMVKQSPSFKKKVSTCLLLAKELKLLKVLENLEFCLWNERQFKFTGLQQIPRLDFKARALEG